MRRIVRQLHHLVINSKAGSMVKGATSVKSSTKTRPKQPRSIEPHSSDAQNCDSAAPSGHHSKAGSMVKGATSVKSSTKTHSKQSMSIEPHSSDAQNCETAAPSGHHSKAGSFDLSSYLFKQSELQLVHKKKVDSAKKSKASEDSKGKKGYAHTKVEKVVSFCSTTEQYWGHGRQFSDKGNPRVICCT